MSGFSFKGSLSDLRRQAWFRCACWVLVLAFGSELAGPGLLRMREAQAQHVFLEPSPGVLLSASPVASLPVLKGIALDPADPLKIDFLVDAGHHEGMDEEESSRLTRYFLTFLTVPEQDLWVNLSPSEPDRIVDQALGGTAAGGDMLREDYLLKQLAASMTFPDREPGKTFWERVYAKIRKEYGNVDVPLNTFSKVWVVPEKAVVYEQQGAAFISESRLKVMLDEDYVTMKKGVVDGPAVPGHVGLASGLYLSIAREVIIPELEREVNEGQYFSRLRQMFHSLVLAIWFKRKLQDHIINRIYTDQKKLAGIQAEDRQASQKIYAQYMLALKKGVYDVIREEYDPDEQQVVPRHYFSGGFSFQDAAQRVEYRPTPFLPTTVRALMGRLGNKFYSFTISLGSLGMSRKSLIRLVLAAGLLAPPVSGMGPQDSVYARPATVTSVARPAAVSEVVVSRGETLPEQDQKYFSFMKNFLGREDMRAIQGKENLLTGKKYDFDWGHIQRHWDSVFSSSVMGWQQEALIVVAQRKMGLREDGKLGQETRRALDARMGGQQQAASRTARADGPRQTGAPVSGTQGKAVAGADVAVKPASPLFRAQVEKAVGERPAPAASRHEGKPVLSPVKPASPPSGKGYALSARTTFDLNEISLQASTGGVVTGLDPDKKEYREGEVIFRLSNPEANQQMVRLRQQLVIEQQRLATLRRLMGQQAATMAEVEAVNVEVGNISRQLAPFLQAERAGIVRAPCRLSATGFSVSNGQMVAKGAPLLNYFSGQRAGFSVRMPAARTDFSRVRVTIDGKPVTGIVNVTCRPDPLKRTEAIVTFLVMAPLHIEAGSAHDVRIVFPSSQEDGFEGVAGAARTSAVVGAAQELVIAAPALGHVKFFVTEGQRVRAGQLLATQESSRGEYRATRALYDRVNAQLQRFDRRGGVNYIPADRITALEKEKAALRARLGALGSEISRSNITAPSAGIVRGLSTQGSFGPGDALMSLKGPVRIGDMSRMDRAVLLPRALAVKMGDPVLLRTSFGKYVTGAVTNINKNPFSRDRNLGALQAVEVTAEDPRHLLGEGMPVKVIMLTDAEKQLVLQKFGRAERSPVQRAVVARTVPVAAPWPDVPLRRQVPPSAAPADTGTSQAGSVPLPAGPAPDISFFRGMPADYNPATALEVDIGKAQRDIVQWKKLVADLEGAGAVLAAREAAGLAVTSESNALDLKVQDARQRLADAQREKDNRIADLFKIRGRPFDEGKNSRFPWGGGFPRVWGDAKGFFNPVYLREMTVEEARAVSDMDKLGRQIGEQKAAYEFSRKAWEESRRQSDLFRPDQLVNERVKMADMALKLNDLEARYFKACLRVREWVRSNSGFRRVPPAPEHAAVPGEKAPVLGDTLAAVRDAVGLPRTAVPLYRAQVARVLTTTDGVPARGRMARVVTPSNDGFLTPGSVIYDNDTRPGGVPLTFIAGTDDQSDETLRVLTEEPNDFVRQQTLDFLLQEGRHDRKFTRLVEQAVLNSVYPDVQQRLLLYMAGRDGGDVRFFVRVIDEALRQKKFTLVGWGFQGLSDIFAQDPDGTKRLSELNYPSGTEGAATRVSPEAARRVMLTFLSWAGEDSIAGIRLLRSDYWTTDQLARIYHASGERSELRRLIHDEIVRREAWRAVEDIGRGPYEKMPALSTKKDIYAYFMLGEGLKSINGSFLTAAPVWRNMEQYLPSWLFGRASEGAGTVLASAGSPASAGMPALHDVRPVFAEGVPMLAYFNGLGIDAQKDHISRTKNIPELGRIFEEPTVLRGMALDRLMMTPQGRILVLQAYAGSGDPELCALVEARGDWSDLLSVDVRHLPDPVATVIVRRALLKMSRNIGEDWPLNIRLKTYTFAELKRADDPRPDHMVRAAVDAEATRLALALLKQTVPYRQGLFSGFLGRQHDYRQGELALIDALEQRINSAGDPREVGLYLESEKERGPAATRALVEDIIYWRGVFAGAIMHNDQSVSSMPFMNKLLLWGSVIFFPVFFFKRWNNKAFLKRAGAQDMILALRREFAVDAVNGNGHARGLMAAWKAWRGEAPSAAARMPAVVVIPPNGIYDGIGEYLVRWQKIAYGWRGAGTGSSPQNLVEGFNSILNNAFQVLRMTPYTPDLMEKVSSAGTVLNEHYQTAFSYFNLLAIDTLHVLDDVVKQHPGLDAHEREILARDAQVLLRMVRYVHVYLRVLEHRGIIDKVMSYKLPDAHWAERSRIYPFFRWVLLYTYQWQVSEKRLSDELPDLLSQGNTLMPGLYPPDIQVNVVRESRQILMDVTQKALSLLSPVRSAPSYKFKMRSFWSRVRTISGPVGLSGAVIMSLLGIISASGGLTLAGVGAVMVSLMIYWVPHIDIMQMGWSSTMSAVTEKLDGQLRARLGDGPADGEGDGQALIVRSALREGSRELVREIAGDKPSVDIVVLVPEDPGYADDLRERYVPGRRGKVLRSDVPVAVMSPRRQGSGNIYFEAMAMVRERLDDETFLESYPALRGKASQDLRVLFVFHGNNADQDDRILDWAIVNGYRASGAMPAAEEGRARGGHIVIYSRDAYFGPMTQAVDDDVNLLGDWVNQQELQTLGLLVMKLSSDGIEVSEILEKLDIPLLQSDGVGKTYRNKVLKYLEDHYDLGRPGLRQFPALSGVMVFGPRAVGVLGKVLDGLRQDPGLWAQLEYLHMTTDVLNNFLEAKDDILTGYLNKRITFADIGRHYGITDPDDARSRFKAFYSMFVKARKDAGDDLTYDPLLPHYGAARVVHIKGPEDAKMVMELLAEDEADASMTGMAKDNGPAVSDYGGLDLSGTRDKVEFRESPAPSTTWPQALPVTRQLQFLQLFRGFDFRITAFGPLEDPSMFLLR